MGRNPPSTPPKSGNTLLMPVTVHKAVIPAAGLGTRFLPATKAQPKEMLALVDKPAIQYVVEEAVRSGINDILIITGRGKRSLEDHFDRSFELEYYLEQKGNFDQLKEMQAIAEMCDIHYVRQGEPKGLGHAVSVARKHVGDQPFVVMLGDDIMHERSGVLDNMLATFESHRGAVVALKEVEPAEIRFYGCATPEILDEHLVRILDIVEKPAVAERALQSGGHGPLRVPAVDLRRSGPGATGSGRRDPAHRRHQDPPRHRGRLRLDVPRWPLRRGQQARLPAGHRRAGPRARGSGSRLPGLSGRSGQAGGPGVIPLAQARARVLSRCLPLPVVETPLAEALGCVTATAVVSGANVPSFANTAMDGYAVRAADTEGATEDRPARLLVVGTVAAGATPDRAVGAGEAVRIMTGAPMPDGADAIAIVEVTSADGDHVLIRQPTRPGFAIRHPGGDLAVGQEVFPAGTVLGPGHLGVLASIGLEKVAAYRRARVGVLSTGDELVQGSVPLQPGQIRDTNRLTLLSLCRQSGFEAVDLGTARDDEDEIRGVIARGVETCDALISSGGVSMGDFDYVKKVLDEIGDMEWMQVAIRPAKPLAFGMVAGKPVFGLPGNPVSSMVSFELFARPGLRQMMGFPDDALDRPRVRGVADDGFARSADGKIYFNRVWAAPSEADGRFHVRSTGGQESHLLRAMALANALAVLPDGDGVAPGGDVDLLLLG